MGFEQMPRYRHCGGDICVSIRGWCFSPKPTVSTSELFIQGVARPLLDPIRAVFASNRLFTPGLPSLHLTSQLPSESGLPQDCLVRELLPYRGRIHSQGSTEASQGRYRRTHR